ncbi:MAG: hypothetical protein QNJ41_01615 [Xenococcaceae cyanobacterium MO_188.B32]|nr:hypothetical protein [Xenococcaceae cyanobacterium MO_188.B32]
MTHKVRRIKDYLSYQQLPQQDEMGQKLTEPQARRQRRSQIQNDAYDIYKASSREEARATIVGFCREVEISRTQGGSNLSKGD